MNHAHFAKTAARNQTLDALMATFPARRNHVTLDGLRTSALGRGRAAGSPSRPTWTGASVKGAVSATHLVNNVIPRPEPSSGDLKVLVAEDEVLVPLMLADALRYQGFQVFEATDADEAIAVLRAMQVDVVITDLHMRAPADGMLVARYVREHCPGIPVLLAAATGPPVDGSVFDAFFVKPYRPEDVASWIKRRGTTPDHAESALP
jgi:CheY-like chemotaxis protein